MKDHENIDTSGTGTGRTEVPPRDVEAVIIAGGEIVGTSADDEPLVEGPNSE